MTKEKKHKHLGKGIRALLANMEADKIQPADKELRKEITSSVAQVPVDWIEMNPFQPRNDFSKDTMEGLVNSIKTHGIIQPLTIRRLGDEEYQLISGERRLRAARIVGLETVPAYIRLADDQLLLEMALVENIQREDLNALEVAISLNRLITECNLTHDSLSLRVGKNRSTVTNYLRLLKLPPEIQQALKDRHISMGHARALAGVEDLAIQLKLFTDVKNKGLSVRALEKLIKSYQNPTSGKALPETQADPEISRIQDDLSAFFGSKVHLKRGHGGKGQIVIHFTTDDGLNHILSLLQELEN
jgi:ParB family chromosome partitioning protein